MMKSSPQASRIELITDNDRRQRFSSESQFIIITHNKLTMAAVDVIYGVYMEEQGVSSLTPVDFRSLKHGSLVQSA